MDENARQNATMMRWRLGSFSMWARSISVSVLFVSAAGLAAASCGGGEGTCDAAAVTAELEAAMPGDVVTLPSCRFEAALSVPRGVTLRGTSESVVVGPSDGPAITLTSDASTASVIEGVHIEGHHTGVRVVGDGEAELRTVVIEVVTGVGLDVASTGTTHVEGATITGGVTEETRDDSRWLRVTSSDAATHGVIATAGDLRIASSTITGFAWLGLALGSGTGSTPSDLDVTVRDTTIGRGLGVGLTSRAESLVLDHVTIEDVWTGVRGWPSYCGFIEAGRVDSDALTLTGCDGYGLVQIAGEAAHDALAIDGTGDVGLWIGASVAATVRGPNAHVRDTAFSAITAVDATSVTLEDVDIATVRAVRRTVLVRGAIEIGDGLELVGSPFTLRNVSIAGAERLGLLLDASASFSADDLTGVTITSEGAGLGAILGTIDRSAEDATLASRPGWDVGITRSGAAITNDAAFSGTLPAIVAPGPPSTGDVLGVIAPMY
ncbi:MAG: hypothetical protein J0L92_28910 [Deltaproteobacteria bacterium]|nr:hypothetical protein [Deltaproteobacteria bacterium]